MIEVTNNYKWCKCQWKILQGWKIPEVFLFLERLTMKLYKIHTAVLHLFHGQEHLGNDWILPHPHSQVFLLQRFVVFDIFNKHLPDASAAGVWARLCCSPEGEEEECLGIMLTTACQLWVVKQPVRRHKRWPMSSAVFCSVSGVYKGVCVCVCVWEHTCDRRTGSLLTNLRFPHAKTCLYIERAAHTFYLRLPQTWRNHKRQTGRLVWQAAVVTGPRGNKACEPAFTGLSHLISLIYITVDTGRD